MSRKITSTKKVTAYITVVFAVAIVLVLLVVGVYRYGFFINNQAAKNDDVSQTVEDSLAKYEHSFVGDNSAVIGIIGALPEGKYIDGVELQTESEPYGIKLSGTDELTAQGIDDISSQLLRLVDNCEWVEIESSQFYSKVTRGGVREFSVIN